MIINGTLIAKGTRADKIEINGVDGSPPSIPLGSSLAFSFTYGITINDYTNAGSTIENTNINQVRVGLGSSDKIGNCTITGFVSAGRIRLFQTIMLQLLLFLMGLPKYE
jgi:hypothetical protein